MSGSSGNFSIVSVAKLVALHGKGSLLDEVHKVSDQIAIMNLVSRSQCLTLVIPSLNSRNR